MYTSRILLKVTIAILEKGKNDLNEEKENFDANLLIQEAINDLQPLIEQKKATLKKILWSTEKTAHIQETTEK